MKKKRVKIKVFAKEEKDSKELMYNALEEVYEELQEKNEKEEKEVLLRRLSEVTQGKSVVFSNYMKV